MKSNSKERQLLHVMIQFHWKTLLSNCIHFVNLCHNRIGHAARTWTRSPRRTKGLELTLLMLQWISKWIISSYFTPHSRVPFQLASPIIFSYDSVRYKMFMIAIPIIRTSRWPYKAYAFRIWWVVRVHPLSLLFYCEHVQVSPQRTRSMSLKISRACFAFFASRELELMNRSLYLIANPDAHCEKALRARSHRAIAWAASLGLTSGKKSNGSWTHSQVGCRTRSHLVCMRPI